MAHPLEDSWVFWHQKLESDYGKNMKPLVEVKTVEEMGSVYNALMRPSKLAGMHEYSICKKGVSPDWNAPANVGGGRLLFQVPKDITDDVWANTIAALVSNCIGSLQKATGIGIVVMPRKTNDTLTVWLGSDSDPDNVYSRLTEELPPLKGLSAEYKEHKPRSDGVRKVRSYPFLQRMPKSTSFSNNKPRSFGGNNYNRSPRGGQSFRTRDNNNKFAALRSDNEH